MPRRNPHSRDVLIATLQAALDEKAHAPVRELEASHALMVSGWPTRTSGRIGRNAYGPATSHNLGVKLFEESVLDFERGYGLESKL